MQSVKISHNMEELGVLVKEKEKHLDYKLQGKFEKRDQPKLMTVTNPDSVAADAKVDDGCRSRLRRALKQLRKDREEERTARELLEEMQQNVDEAQERTSESGRSLCRELEEYVYSWTDKLEDRTTSVRKSGR